MTIDERFWAKVDKGDGTGCWLWTRATNSYGYGIFAVTAQDTQLAHRIAWALTNGPIPEGLHCLHRCDNPPCVRPSHLFVGTALDNALDRERKSRGNHVTGDRHGSRTHPEAYPQGEDRPAAKLTEADVREIRRRRKAGQTLKAIAADYGVHHVTILRASTGANWAYLDA